MALTCASMAAEVQALCGRTDDTVLITSSRIAQWFNEAQHDLVDRLPGLHALTFKNTTSLDSTQTLAYSINDITGGDFTSQIVAHVWGVRFLDGNNTNRLHFVHTDEFDNNWPDPTHADAPYGKPTHWTRRAKNIEMRPVCSCSYCDYDLRFDGDCYARDFTSGDSSAYSDLSQADHILESYALSQAWLSIGDSVKATLYATRYEGFVDDYGRKNNNLEEWDGNLFFDSIE